MLICFRNWTAGYENTILLNGGFGLRTRCWKSFGKHETNGKLSLVAFGEFVTLPARTSLNLSLVKESSNGSDDTIMKFRRSWSACIMLIGLFCSQRFKGWFQDRLMSSPTFFKNSSFSFSSEGFICLVSASKTYQLFISIYMNMSCVFRHFVLRNTTEMNYWFSRYQLLQEVRFKEFPV